jgi:major membrane immunogen (membrane-anchored lipoprotein)
MAKITYSIKNKRVIQLKDGKIVDVTDDFYNENYGELQERENSQVYQRISMNILKDPVQEELNNLSDGIVIKDSGLDKDLRFIY